MLVLSRKRHEEIIINDEIILTVVEIRGDKVRLGVVAPKDVPVHRREVYQAINSGFAKQVTRSLKWNRVGSENRWIASSFFGDEENREEWEIEKHSSGLFTIMPSDMQMAVAIPVDCCGCETLAEAKRKCEKYEAGLEEYFRNTGAEIDDLIACRDASNAESSMGRVAL